jgi:hypothetical protein
MARVRENPRVADHWLILAAIVAQVVVLVSAWPTYPPRA